MRRAMEPVDLIKRVKEIEQEAYGEHGMSTQEDAKQTAAVDLSKRLKDLRQGNDGSSPKGYSIHLSLFPSAYLGACCTFGRNISITYIP